MIPNFPPPHYIFFEPLNDIKMEQIWNTYKETNNNSAEFFELDAIEQDTFISLFENIITKKSLKKLKILLIWHTEFLTFATQQIIRRMLETRSFTCRIWFHTENYMVIQSAIQSRCITKLII